MAENEEALPPSPNRGKHGKNMKDKTTPPRYFVEQSLLDDTWFSFFDG
jgi:hypothetical protein